MYAAWYLPRPSTTATAPRYSSSRAARLTVLLLQQRRQELPGVAISCLRHDFGRALDDHHPTSIASLGPQVDDPVGSLDDIEVVLDDGDRVSLVDEAAQNGEELADVLEVEACRGLVEDV